MINQTRIKESLEHWFEWPCKYFIKVGSPNSKRRHLVLLTKGLIGHDRNLLRWDKEPKQFNLKFKD